MYMVPTDLYNRLLNIADTNERKEISKVNQTESGEKEEERESSTSVPNPFDKVQEKIEELEQKINILSRNQTDDLTSSQTQTESTTDSTNAESQTETMTKESESQTLSPTTNTTETQTTSPDVKSTEEMQTQTEHDHIYDKSPSLKLTKKSKHMFYPKESYPNWKELKEKRKTQLEKVKKNYEESLKELQKLQKETKPSVTVKYPQEENIPKIVEKGVKRKKSQKSSVESKKTIKDNETEDKSSVFTCDICKKVFSSSNSLGEHYEIEHNMSKKPTTKRTKKTKNSVKEKKLKQYVDW